MQNPSTATTKHFRYIGETPMRERIEFMRFLNDSGFTTSEIASIYPQMPRYRVEKILDKRISQL